ncbi:flagellar protein MotX [Neiella marina]|uniref:Flagellar protein MotX n=2 Tax=Neiella holothuriorum TaxID=2870530 RepID=A0ABS7EH62_9GAMM|nr:flagellar protein MotX [Neiella holothuriorum]
MPNLAKAESILSAVQIYSQDELLELINKNEHLKRVRDDDCQLVEDIKARAEKMKVPAYQFLYGDMLLYGVCIERDAQLGMLYIERSAAQGLPDALEQLGRYHAQGKFVRANKVRAVEYLYTASSTGHIKAQMQLVELYLEGYGDPSSYYDVYHWLHNAIIGDRKDQKRAGELLLLLAQKMPAELVKQAQRPLER